MLGYYLGYLVKARPKEEMKDGGYIDLFEEGEAAEREP